MDVAVLTARVTADTQNFSSGIGRAGSQWASFVKDVGGGANSLTSTMARGLQFGAGFGAGLAGVRGLAGVFDAGRDAVIGFNSQLQKSTITFTAFAGSVELGQQFLAQLKELAATTPFEFQDVLKGAQRFAGMGLAMENIIPIMKDISVLSQAMGISPAEIDRINIAISQVVARGKVSAQEMNQLANSGIPAWQIMAQAMNKTVGEVMKLAEASELSTADFLNAFDKAAHDPKMLALAQAMNKSFDTAMSNVHDRLQFFAADAGKPIFEMATDIANGLANLLGTPVIQGMAQGISMMVEGMVRALDPLGAAFNAAFAKLQTGDLSGALRGLLSSINAFATQMFGAGYTLVTTMASGMLSGLGAVVSAAADIAASIAGFFIGASPPPMGPLSEIEAGGQNLMSTYVDGMAGGLGDLNTVTQGVADAFGNVNREMSLNEGRMALQNAAGNAALLKTEAADAAGVIQNLDGMLHEVERTSQAVKFAADDIKQSYEDQITPLQDAADAILKQNDLLDKQLDIADRIRDAELHRAELAASGDPVQRAKLQTQIDANNEKLKEMRLTQSEKDLEQQIAEARKNKKDTGSLQARLAELQIQKQNAELEKQQAGLVNKTGLAQVKQEQAVQKEQEDRRRTEQEIQKLHREQAAAPLLEMVQKLKAEEQARLKPLEDQVKTLERQHAILQAQRQDWAELKQDIAAATAEIEKGKKATAGAGGATAGGGLAGLNITPMPIAPINEAATKLAADFGAKFKEGVDGWFQAHGGEFQGAIAGGIIGGIAFGPLGILIGGMFGQAFVKGLQEKFPDVGKLVQEKLSVASFAVEAFGKILQGQDQYILPFQLALEHIVPAPFQGLIAGAGQAIATLRDAVLTVVQVFQNQWSPGIDQASSGIDPFVRNVGLAATWIRDTLVPALSTAAMWLGANVPAAIALAQAGWQALITIVDRVGLSLNKARDFIQQVYDKMVEQGTIKTFSDTMGGLADIVDKINGFLTTFQTDLDSAGGAAGRNQDPVDRTAKSFETLALNIKSIVDGVNDFLDTMKKIEDALNTAHTAVVNAGIALHEMWLQQDNLKLGIPLLLGPLGSLFTVLEQIATVVNNLPKTLPAWMTGGGGGGGTGQGSGGGGARFTSFHPGGSGLPPGVIGMELGGTRDQMIANAAKQFGLDEATFWRQLQQESGNSLDVNLTSSAGARGPGQFMPGTGNEAAGMLGVSPDQFWASAELQIQGAAAEMRKYVDQFGSYTNALIAYNAGPGAVGNYLPGETQAYLNSILPNGEPQGPSTGQLMSFAPSPPPRWDAPSPQVDQAATDAINVRAAAQVNLNDILKGTPAVNTAVATSTTVLTGAQQQGATWAQQMADQQAAFNQVINGAVPAGRAATDALSAMSAVIGPVERQVAGGASSVSNLQFKLLDLSRATGLNTDAWQSFNSGTVDSTTAMEMLIRSSAPLGPQFANIATYLDSAGSSSTEAALQFLQAIIAYGQLTPVATTAATAQTGLANATDATASAIDPLAGDKSALIQTTTQAAQALSAALDGTTKSLGDVTGAAGKTTDEITKLSDGLHNLADFLDKHEFHVQIKVDDVDKAFLPGSPTPFEVGLWGIHKALTSVSRVIPPSLRNIPAPELASMANGTSGGSTADGANAITTHDDHRTVVFQGIDRSNAREMLREYDRLELLRARNGRR